MHRWITKLLIVVAVLFVFGFLRGGADYFFCMKYMPQNPFYNSVSFPLFTTMWDIWIPFLMYGGLIIPIFLGRVELTFLGGVGNFLAENMFYMWVNLFGNGNGCYDWHTGNPLNPDGMWGYGWTNPMNMVEFFKHSMSQYITLTVWLTFIVYLGKNIMINRGGFGI